MPESATLKFIDRNSSLNEKRSPYSSVLPLPNLFPNELKLDFRTFDRDLRMLRPSHSNVNRNKKMKRICNIDGPQIFDATNRLRPRQAQLAV